MPHRCRRSRRGEKGEVVEFVTVVPIFFLLFVVGIVQVVIATVGGYVATEAAQRGVDSARVVRGSIPAGMQDATHVLRSLGTDLLTSPTVRLTRVIVDGHPAIHAEVDAGVVQIVPWPFHVHAQYEARVEQVTP
jgi:hypothetical protein